MVVKHLVRNDASALSSPAFSSDPVAAASDTFDPRPRVSDEHWPSLAAYHMCPDVGTWPATGKPFKCVHSRSSALRLRVCITNNAACSSESSMDSDYVSTCKHKRTNRPFLSFGMRFRITAKLHGEKKAKCATISQFRINTTGPLCGMNKSGLTK